MNNALLLLLALGVTTGPAAAVTVLPGETVPLGGTTVADRPELGGSVLDQLSHDFEVVDDGGITLFTGTVAVRLVSFASDIAGYVDGVYSQEYRVTSFDALSGFQIQSLRTAPLFFPMVDVDYRTDEPGSVGPAEASLGGDSAPVLTFHFVDPIVAGETSFWSFVHETGNDIATGFGMQGAALVITGPEEQIFEVPFPSAVLFTPLPGALWLFLSALVLVPGMARYRGA